MKQLDLAAAGPPPRCWPWLRSARRRRWPRCRRASTGRRCRAANAVPLIFNSISGNTNPFDPAHTGDAGRRIRRDDGAGGLCAHLHAGRPRGHGARSCCRWGASRATVTVAGRTSTESAQRLRRPDARVHLQPHRPEGAEEHSRRAALRAGLLARPARRPGAADRRVRQQPAAEPRARTAGTGASARPSSGSSATGCRAGARRWNSCPRCGCSATTTTTSARR
ncbi:MAG: hypothetical protein M0C28_30835 [Candidatus Moduliflexus flocculans]|nr:hypothetical protein [Candidatus Moduliflexus flocculans]